MIVYFWVLNLCYTLCLAVDKCNLISPSQQIPDLFTTISPLFYIGTGGSFKSHKIKRSSFLYPFLKNVQNLNIEKTGTTETSVGFKAYIQKYYPFVVIV